ncbi:hypothetical protein DW267_04490 [Bacteroides sp. AM22-3LB]|nr:hypothetical protein DW267_04490 [Bacteroides sp. AM22-3LB]
MCRHETLYSICIRAKDISCDCRGNDNIVILSVGAGLASPKTQSKLFSGERTLPLRTKRQHYPRFDTPLLIDWFSFGIPLLFIVCFVFTA